MSPPTLPQLQSPDEYQNWSETLTTHLQLQGVWRYVDGTMPKPTKPSTSDTAAQNGYLSLLDKWLDGDERAHGIICSSLSQAIGHEVIHLASAKSVWDKLKDKYDVVVLLEGLQTAITTHYDDCRDIHDYIQRMSRALDKLDRSLKSDEKLGESLRVQFLLCNLGEQWSAFLTAYLNSKFDKESATFDSVQKVLVQEAMRVKFSSARR